MLKNLFLLMKEWGASDLFLKDGAAPYVRVQGRVQPLSMAPLTAENINGYVRELLDPEQWERFQRSPDLDVAILVPQIGRFRINVLRQQGAPGLVIRLVHSGNLTFADLGLPDGVRQLAEKKRGLILVTGAAGSGKSTTVAAIIHHINITRPGHIVTIEDPIEYVHQDGLCLIDQRQVGRDTMSFANGLKHVIRQSPDVIVIGEIRDLETISIAISASQTGHLVVTTMHTADAVQTLDRIVNYYPDYNRNQVRKELSLCLQGIVSQRLLARADGRGRVPALEIMITNPGIRKSLAEGKHQDVHQIMARHQDMGMSTLDLSLLHLVQQQIVTDDEALANATNPEGLRLNLSGMFSNVADNTLELI